MLTDLPKTVKVFLPTREFFATYAKDIAQLQKKSNVQPDDFARLTTWFLMSDPNQHEFPAFDYFHELIGEVLARDADVDTFHFGTDEARYEKFVYLLYELYKFVRPYQQLVLTTQVPGARVSQVWFEGWSGQDMLISVEFQYTLMQMEPAFLTKATALKTAAAKTKEEP